MEELIKTVTEKAGISTDQAKTAVSTVVDFLKAKLPAPIAGQIDNVMGGGGSATDGIGGIAAKVGGLFGK